MCLLCECFLPAWSMMLIHHTHLVSSAHNFHFPTWTKVCCYLGVIFGGNNGGLFVPLDNDERRLLTIVLTPCWTRSCVFYRPTPTWFLLTEWRRRRSVSSTKSQLSADFPWKPSPRQSDRTLQSILQASTSIRSQQKGSQIPPHAQARR